MLLFGISSKISRITQKELANDIRIVKDFYQSFGATDVALVHFKYNIPDALAKCKAHYIMIETLINEEPDHLIQ